MQQKELTKYDYLDLIYEEPYKIGQWLGFDLLTELHNEWLQDMIFGNFTRPRRVSNNSFFMIIHLVMDLVTSDIFDLLKLNCKFI